MMLKISTILIFLLSCCCMRCFAICGISMKLLNNGSCVPLDNLDVIKSLHFLASPQTTLSCNKITTVQDISVCEDNLPKNCIIWSMISSNWCDHYGSLEFEKYWSERGCSVTLYHFLIYFKGNTCTTPPGPMKEYPNINIIRYDMWGGKCFNCFYKVAKKDLTSTNRIDVLKIQGRAGVNEDFDGVQYSVLSDLFLHVPEITEKTRQIAFTASLNTRTLIDFVGREAEHGWNMWATVQLLKTYASFEIVPMMGPPKIQPQQYTHLLTRAQVDPSFSFYQHTFIKLLSNEEIEKNKLSYDNWKPSPPPYELKGIVPDYCQVPSEQADKEMQEWIKGEINARCHPNRLWVVCDRSRGYDAIIPCPLELMGNLAEDYAASKNWCDFTQSASEIVPLMKVDEGAKLAFQKSPLKCGVSVRLAFFFTVYSDAKMVKRLFKHLYSRTHYYLIHIDPTGSSYEFEQEMKYLANNHTNVFLSKEIPIVYGASTATILLTKAMAWFHKYATGWDYFVPLTGSDYPLVPLKRIEHIFTYQNPPMPFVMAWTPGTSTHIFRLEKTHPVFETDPLLKLSIKAVTDERGRVLGAVPMEYRSNNFGPPLFCYNKSNFAHLDNRSNKSERIHDTQWLFPRDIFKGRGRAYGEENPLDTTPSFDGRWRVWKKSDPATTGAYDKESVAYIVDSEEGRKYWHFFKHMLLGSEEHYYVSLLYNWSRTKRFVQTLSAEIVWNTWELGLWEQSSGFQTHTHFLTLNEWDILKGFSMRGMMFARKFSSVKTAALLDRIDAEILGNSSTEAGAYWPGYFEVDTTTPGKQWVAAYRRNQTMKSKKTKPNRIHV